MATENQDKQESWASRVGHALTGKTAQTIAAGAAGLFAGAAIMDALTGLSTEELHAFVNDSNLSGAIEKTNDINKALNEGKHLLTVPPLVSGAETTHYVVDVKQLDQLAKEYSSGTWNWIKSFASYLPGGSNGSELGYRAQAIASEIAPLTAGQAIGGFAGAATAILTKKGIREAVEKRANHIERTDPKYWQKQIAEQQAAAVSPTRPTL